MKDQRGKRFGDLLNEAINKLKRETRKLISAIQDELGYAIGREGGTAIEYWRKGHVPSNHADVAALAREIVNRINVTSEWLEEFLTAGKYPNPKQLSNELLSYLPTTPIFYRSYRSLIGREGIIEDIMNVFRDTTRRRIIGIDGMGGIGKTALTQEIVGRAMQEIRFDAVIWADAQSNNLFKAYNTPNEAFTFDALLNTIGISLGVPNIVNLSLKEKELRIHALLQQRRVLLVWDNLETAQEDQNELARRLLPFLKSSKAFLVSRHRFSGDVYSIHLSGLDNTAAEKFIQQEIEEKHLYPRYDGDQNEIASMIEVTGGSPLAMQLVLGQRESLPLEHVLGYLRAERTLAEVSEDDVYTKLYKHIFLHSWRLLSESGRQLLIAMGGFSPDSGASFEAVKAASGFKEEILIRNITELWRLSFLERSRSSSLGQIRYYLHALTRYFVLSDILELFE